MAIGCVAALAAAALGTRYVNRTEQPPAVPPFAEPMEIGDPIVPPVEDLRRHPAFDEAYATVCDQTNAGLDAILAATEVAGLVTTIQAEYQSLTRRIASVYDREELWSATDPLVLEFAETIAEDLAAILDGTDVGLSYLDGDVTLFRSLCQDWYTPA